MLAPEVAVQPGSRAASRQSQYGETEAAEAVDAGGGETNMAAVEAVAQHGGGTVNHKSDTDEAEDSNDEEVTRLSLSRACCGYVSCCGLLKSSVLSRLFFQSGEFLMYTFKMYFLNAIFAYDR